LLYIDFMQLEVLLGWTLSQMPAQRGRFFTNFHRTF